MRALSIATIREEELVSGLLPGAIKSLLRPLQALIAAPALLFLTALTAMLFCHPDVSFHRLNRVTFALLIMGVIGRAVVLKQEVLRFDRVSWPMIALTVVVLISLVGRAVDEDTWGVLAAKYLFPFTLFHLAQLVFTEEQRIRRLEVFALVVLAYLSFTAIVFLLGLHDLVFLVLMEAMARGKVVLAPAITGIPELVIPGRTGFLYEPGSMWDFLEKVMEISCLLRTGPPLVDETNEDAPSRAMTEHSIHRLDWVRHAALVHVRHNFNRKKNLQSFTELFLQHVFRAQGEALPHASSVLQQI